MHEVHPVKPYLDVCGRASSLGQPQHCKSVKIYTLASYEYKLSVCPTNNTVMTSGQDALLIIALFRRDVKEVFVFTHAKL